MSVVYFDVAVIAETNHDYFQRSRWDIAGRNRDGEWYDDDRRKRLRAGEMISVSLIGKPGYKLDTYEAPDDALLDAKAAAIKVDMPKYGRLVDTIIAARQNDFRKPMPSFDGFDFVLQRYLQADMIDGWLYQRGEDGKLYAYLITGIKVSGEGRGGSREEKEVTVALIGYGIEGKGFGTWRNTSKTLSPSLTFNGKDVVRRTVASALEAKGFFKETPELKAEYVAAIARYNEAIPNFAKQYRVHGIPFSFHDADREYCRTEPLDGLRVIHDLAPGEYRTAVEATDSSLTMQVHSLQGTGFVPQMPLIRVFDLRGHGSYWVHVDLLTPYEYDTTLRSKLILPESHRDILDVLTTDLDAFVDDFIEGKTAGNVILCKGVPGVGKTSTAECYAEEMGVPLLYVNASMLGDTAASVAKGLKTVFAWVSRWGCAVLLDECDVYVMKRGSNIDQNTIVAEFLRTLEYLRDLMFMTTNRPDDIDEAIIARCAAIIDFEPPAADLARKIWVVQAANFGATFSPELLSMVGAAFPRMAPRDMKMLLRNVLRVGLARNKPMNIEMFRQQAVFRAIKFADTFSIPAGAEKHVLTVDKKPIRRAA